MSYEIKKNQARGAFQVKKTPNIIEKHKKKLAVRLKNIANESDHPVFAEIDADYDISEKVSAIHCGGICM